MFFRFIQGTGAAGGYFLARTIPADIYQGRELAKLMALIELLTDWHVRHRHRYLAV